MKLFSKIAALLIVACLFVSSHADHPRTGLRRPLVKPGRCPKYFESFAALKHCYHDRDCPGANKCCAFSHRFGCAPPVPVTLGCPTPRHIGLCTRTQGCIRGCRHGQKCCFNGCGHQCMTPVPVKPRKK